MKTIIIPTDFSTVAVNAMNYALNMAKDIKARVILFHAFQVPIAFSEVPVVTVSIDEMQHDSQERLAALKKDVEHVTSGEIEIHTLSRLGDVVEELANLCEEENPFAVVMGTKGAGKLERLLIGSNTLTAIKRLPVPVMIIPPGSTYKKIQKIGFACDFSKVKETTPLKEIADLLATFGASLHILNVDYNERHFSGDMVNESVYLHSLLAHLNPSYHYLNSVNVEEGINSFSDANSIDLLLTIPKKHNIIESIFLKSHSHALILHAHIPIVAIHE